MKVGFTRRFRAMIIASLVGANLLMLALVTHSLYQSRQQFELRAHTLTQNIAVAIDQSVSNTISRVDLVLRATTDELEHQLASGGIDERRMQAFILRQEDLLPDLEAIRVANAQGLVIFGKGLKKEERPNWADRDYFLTLRANADAGLQISKPRVGRVAKKYIIGFARRYNTPDGRFAGVVSAPVAVDHFAEVIASYDLGPTGAVVLRDASLGLIARYPAPSNPAIAVVGNTSVSNELRALIEGGVTETSYHTRLASDQTERIIALRHLSQAPFYVLTGIASEDYLAGWRFELYTKAALVAGFMLLSLLSAIFLHKLLGRLLLELEERQQLENTERRRRASHQRLNEIAANSHLATASQLRQALQIGSDHLGLEFGIVSEIEADSYRVFSQVSPPDTLFDGQVFPVGETYCSMVLAENKVVAIANMGSSAHAGHPCYRAFKLETYIGAPLIVAGRIIGTVNFSSPTPYQRHFDEGDIEFIGLLARWVGSVIERDQAQRLLADSQTHLQAIVETEPECVKVVAPDGTLLKMNRAGLNMLEAEALEQVAGRSICELIAPEWRKAFMAMHEQVMQGASAILAFEVLGLKGGRRWLETHAVPLRDGDGSITGQLAVTRDITQQKQAEAELRDAMQKAEAANVAKSQFLATMSHEIRTPLNGILGMAHLLMMEGLSDDERRDYARTIMSSGQTLLTLLNDILDLSKVDAGKLSLSHELFSPHQLIDETVALQREAAQSKNIRLNYSWSGLADQLYLGDPVRLRQMLSNLLSNAIKFTDTGEVRIEASEQTRSGSAVRLMFSVTDTGVGIPADQMQLLFQPFTQLDGTTTRRHGGTGLGLSIVRRLAELMGGTAEAESTPGQGASFRFTAAVELAATTDNAQGLPVASAVLDCQSAENPRRMLVVEDNETNRMVVEAMLGKMGYHVDTAANGRIAVDLVTQGSVCPDLILMDCQMPEMNGFEATRAIRAWESGRQTRRVPIVALTAAAFQEDRANCLAAGMDDFLAKPVSFGELATLLAKWL